MSGQRSRFVPQGRVGIRSKTFMAFAAAVVTLATMAAGPGRADATTPSPFVSILTIPASGPVPGGLVVEVKVARNHVFRRGTHLVIEECRAASPGHPFSIGPCDRKTIQSGPLVAQAHGTADYLGYPILALPDATTLGESARHRPRCDLTHACVLVIGSSNGDGDGDQDDGFQRAVWSDAFFVDPNPVGTNPGNGTPEVPSVLALPVVAAAILGGVVLIRRRRAARSGVG